MTATEQKRKWRISRRLKLTRANATPKLSQAELARRVQAKGLKDFTTALASRLELGYADAIWPEVEAIAEALGVQAEWLAEIATTLPPPPQMGIARSQALSAQPSSLAVLSPVASAKPLATIAATPSAPPPPPAPPASPAAPPVPASAPLGMVASAAAFSLTSTPLSVPNSAAVAPSTQAQAPAPAALPPTSAAPLPPLVLPPQGSISIYEYRTLLGVERKKADESMARKGLSAAEWRRWREYSMALTDTLRTLQI